MRRVSLRIAALILAVCAFASLMGCGSMQYDAKGHVQGDLDAQYKKIFSEKYLASVTNTEEELAKIYEEGIEYEAEYLAYYFDMDLDKCSDGIKTRLQEVCKKMYGAAKYEVGDAVKSNDMFVVGVTVYPIDLIDHIANEHWDEFEKEWTDGYKEIAGLSEDEIEEHWADKIVTILEDNVDKIGYLEPETVSVQVVKDENDLYIISDNDFSRLNTLMIKY